MTVHIPLWLPFLLLNVAALAGLTAYVRRRPVVVRGPVRLWLVGEFKGTTRRGHVIWLMRGVFAERARAVAECKGKAYFVAPVEVDALIPDDGVAGPRCEYPHLSEGNHGA